MKKNYAQTQSHLVINNHWNWFWQSSLKNITWVMWRHIPWPIRQRLACLADHWTHISVKYIILKQHFYWSKQSYTKISISIYGKKRTDIIDLSYNIEECLTVNDYFTDWLEFEIINSLQPLLLHINTSRRKYLFEADDNQTFDSIHHLFQF